MASGIRERDLDELAEVTPAPWTALEGARIFLTGGTGMVGRWVVEALLGVAERRGISLRLEVLLRRPETWGRMFPCWADHPAVRLWAGDVRDFAGPPSGCTHILHMAGSSDGRVWAEDPTGCFESIVFGTWRVLEWGKRCCPGARVLLVSSGAVYGRHPKVEERVAETSREGPDAFDPGQAYDEGKRAAEMVGALANATGRLTVMSARLFSVLGPWMPLDWHFAAGNFIRDGLKGGPIRVAGDGTAERGYLYASDAAWWLWTMLARGRGGVAYNVCGDELVNMAGLARRTAACFDPPPRVEIAGVATPGAGINRQMGDSARAERELGLRVRVGLDEALRRTVAFFREA